MKRRVLCVRRSLAAGIQVFVDAMDGRTEERMVENSKDAVREGLGTGVEFVGLRGSGGVVGAYLPGSSEGAMGECDR